MLIARQLCFGGENMPRHQLDFTLERGQILLIQGRSGIGKTTLLNIIAGFLDADSGELVWQETMADKNPKVKMRQITSWICALFPLGTGLFPFYSSRKISLTIWIAIPICGWPFGHLRAFQLMSEHTLPIPCKNWA